MSLAYLVGLTHRREAPFVRQFRFGALQMLLDVDRVGETAARLKLFSHNAFNLFSFYDRDHGARDGSSLRAFAQRGFSAAGIELEGGALQLLCFPRVLGQVFNPLSIYFGFGPGGDLRGVIYQVHNTFGESHAYVAPADCGPLLRHAAPKSFHVSPFFDVAQEYRFTLRPPGETFAVHIENWQNGTRVHVASSAGQAHALNDRFLLRMFSRFAFQPAAVLTGIHLHALRIWRRGARYRRKPAAPRREFTIARTQTPPSFVFPSIGLN